MTDSATLPEAEKHIFISYDRRDKQKADKLAAGVKAKGFTVWRDIDNLKHGDVFPLKIKEAILESACVIVLWSHHSIESEFVLDEADLGKKTNRLFPVLLENVDKPLGFGRLHTADLREWDGTHSHPEFVKLVDSLGDWMKTNAASLRDLRVDTLNEKREMEAQLRHIQAQLSESSDIRIQNISRIS